jgi:4-hydroxythreonine-4-phosphate dehydrogenase
MSKSRASDPRPSWLPRIALTSGEPAGIGPELCAQLAALHEFDCELVCLGDRQLIESRALDAGVALRLTDADARPGSAVAAFRRGHLEVLHVPLRTGSEAGRLDPANSPYVIELLDQALAGVAARRFDAIVTAPVHKGIINDAGVPFTGHTEYLAARTGAAQPVMLLVADRLRVALATTHLPLREVSAALTSPLLQSTLRILDADLRRLWGMARPRIAVCGLNPHAGESGHLGDEELRVIQPAIEAVRRAGIDAFGPLPADTAFVPRELARCDAVLAMFHDQGLPVLKHAGFGHAVNVTLGLPIIRTSVDHGTALDLAGTGRADAGSLEAAVRLAIGFSRRRGPLEGLS